MKETPEKPKNGAGRPVKNIIKKLLATAKEIAKSMVAVKAKRWGKHPLVKLSESIPLRIGDSVG